MQRDRPSGLIVIGCVMLSLFLMGAGKVTLYLDESHTTFIEVEKQDCEVYETVEYGVVVGLKIGTLLFNVGPEMGFSRKVGIEWDRTIHSLIARYKELCTRFNTGGLTKREYEDRLQEIDDLYQRAKQVERELFPRIRSDAQGMQQTLRDRVSEYRSGDAVDHERKLTETLRTIATKAERLIGR